MDFKDQMIWAEEQGLTTAENAYDYVRESLAERAEDARKAKKENPPPVFAVGDRVIWPDSEGTKWTGYITSTPRDSEFAFVKLDVGGTFLVHKPELSREAPRS